MNNKNNYKNKNQNGSGEKKYVVFFKPYGVLAQFTGAEDQETLSSFGLPKELYAAGRLDKDSEGLLLLTNDGVLIHRFLHPNFAHSRTYWVQVEGVITEAALQQLAQGVKIKGYLTKPAKVRFFTDPPPVGQRHPPIRFRAQIPTSWVEIILFEGKNRQVRRMTAAVGFPTLRLIRVALGNLTLFPLLPGGWREISGAKVRILLGAK